MGMQQNTVHTTSEVRSEISKLEENHQLGKGGTSPIRDGGGAATPGVEGCFGMTKSGGKSKGVTNTRDNPHGSVINNG